MLKDIFFGRNAYWAISFLLLQQLIVASSTIWIALLSEAVVLQQDVTTYLILFVSSLFIVYFPGIAAGFHLEKAKNRAQLEYARHFMEAHKNKPFLLTDTAARVEREPWLTAEAGRTLDEAFSMGYDSLSTFLNTTLSILALCIIFGPEILIGYVGCIIVLPIASKVFERPLRQKAAIQQADRKALSNGVLNGWDNIVTGNQENYGLWWTYFKRLWERVDNSSTRAVFFTQVSSVSSVLFSLAPVAGNFVWMFHNETDPARMAAMVATLPRQIQIMQHFEILATYVMHWHGTLERIQHLSSSIIQPIGPNQQTLLSRIKWEALKFKCENTWTQLGSFDALLDMIKQYPKGRITLMGANGAGKTTLISLLKQTLGDNAFFLPTHAKLCFHGTEGHSLSTGEKMRVCLDEVAEKLTHAETSQPRVLILDEWNANLDIKNGEIISQQLDEIAKKSCVIEILHKSTDVSQKDPSAFITPIPQSS